MTAEFHMLFNLVLAAIFIGLLDAVAWLLVRILPERKQPADPSLPRYLDETTLDTPSLAIANAARETLAAKAVQEPVLSDIIRTFPKRKRAF